MRCTAYLLGLGLAHLAACSTQQENPPVPTDRASFPVQAVEQGALVHTDPTQGDAFGAATAVSGDTAMVGFQDPSKGKVLVFRRVGSTWSLESTITVPPAYVGLVYFGYSLALQQDRAIVGAPADDPVNARAFVYERSAATWNLQATLAPASPEANYFGLSVALDGGTIAVGAPDYATGGGDRAYVFVGSGAAWTEQAALIPGGPASQGSYGVSVSVTGDDLLVGAPYAATPSGGGVFAYRRAGTVWGNAAFIEPPSGSPSDGAFGNSVSAQGSIAVVGAPGVLFNSTGHTGLAFVLARDPGGWTATETIAPLGGELNGYFGCSVSLDGRAALVGAFGYNQPGKAYLFEEAGGVWTQHQAFVSSTAEDGSGFGYAVGLSGTAAAVGQPGFFNAKPGEAWAYRVQGGIGRACGTTDDCQTGFCVDGVCCESECGGADPNDCVVCSVAAGSGVDGTCSPLSGAKCTGGVCEQGVCVAPDGGAGGAAGAAGSGGAAGAAGSAGTGGDAGAAGTAGTSGSGGAAGAAGTGGSAGSAGTGGAGGTAGASGSSPTGGTGGEGLAGGSGGGAGADAGTSGSAGTGGSSSPNSPQSAEDGGFYSCGLRFPHRPRPLVLVILGFVVLGYRRRCARD